MHIPEAGKWLSGDWAVVLSLSVIRLLVLSASGVICQPVSGRHLWQTQPPPVFTWSFMKLTTSEWPTIPQVYVKGEFVGGCDIMLSSKLVPRSPS